MYGLRPEIITPSACETPEFEVLYPAETPSAASQSATSSPGKFPYPTESSRTSDTDDAFASYKYASECGISSIDLHMPFSPLCLDKKSLLRAMSGGGRPGYDMPYVPLSCDMRWYSTEEACTILTRFSHVAFIGDSLMRHIVNAMYVFLRADIGYGAIADWDLDLGAEGGISQREDCMCAAQTGKHICSNAVISQTSWVTGNTSIASEYSPLACSPSINGDINLSFTRSNAYPATQEELEEIRMVLPETEFNTPRKPYAFVLHSTFWNNVNATATVAWVEQITEHLRSTVPSLSSWSTHMNRIFVTANAGGLSKNAQYLEAQGNQQLGNFEKDISPTLEERGVDVLGCFNMSLQALTSDGTHASFASNLLKAQMILNWLESVER